MAKKMKSKKRTRFSKAMRGLLMVLLSIFLVFFLTAFTVGGYFIVNVMKVVGGDAVIRLEDEKANQSQTTVIYAYDKSGQPVEYARLHGEQNRMWLDLNKMGEPNMNTEHEMPMIADAYIALEDKRFWDHSGVDWTRFISVFVKYELMQGGSTLTQQLIKNVTQEKDVTAIRKYNEILTALNLERNYEKTVILEAYLNELYLGRGCYGVKTGAERYFGKDVSELNIAECAALAAITKAPSSYDPINHPEKNRSRQMMCLDNMLEQGKITQAQYDEAVAYKMVFTPEATVSTQQATEKYNYYVDHIIETVISDLMEQMEMSEKEATRKVFYGGLKIYAAVDMDIQNMMEDVFRNRTTFSSLRGTVKNPINASMAVMDYEGRLVGVVGEAGNKSGNRSLNRATQSWRQPGSTIKPLAVYGPAIEKNLIHWSTLTQNSAFAYKGEMWPHNVDGTYGNGAYVTVQEAIAKSINTVSARIVNYTLKSRNAYDYLDEHFEFEKLDEYGDPILPPMSVGSMTYGFSAMEEAAAYATFGNGGTYYSPYCYYRVMDNTGNKVILNKDQKVERAFSEDTAKVMNELLRTVPLNSFYSGNNAKNIGKFKKFGKTGTTNDNKDRWFAGGTPYYVGAVWFGYDTPEDLGQLANPSAKIWMEVFNRIHSGLDASKNFPTTKKAVQKSYCKRSGLLAGSNCSATASGWYRTNNVPKTCTSCRAATTAPAETQAENQTSGGQAIQDWINQILGGDDSADGGDED